MAFEGKIELSWEDHIEDGYVTVYGETEDEEWHNCTWMKDEIYIKLRPLHTEEGGLVMIWSF